MTSEKNTGASLEDPKINIRILLASFWICQFLLWTFGDMVSLLQQLNDPVSEELLLFAAAPLAITQTFMIVFSLIGKPVHARWANIGVGALFLLINIGFLAEGGSGWHNLLGLAYITFNLLTIYYAWNWPKHGEHE